MDVSEVGSWINPDGYDLRWKRRVFWPWPGVPSLWRLSIWEFRLDTKTALTFRHPSGFLVQPDRHRDETDLGSIPPPQRSLFPADEFFRPYVFHDSGYRDRGFYVDRGQGFVFESWTRAQVDELLRLMIISDGGTRLRAWVVWSAVRAFGPRW